MIIFISSLLCTIQLVLQHCNCLNLIDLQHGGVVHSPKWKLESRRAPAIYERMMANTLPRKREITSNFRRYLYGNKKPQNKIFFKASRRVYELEREASLKRKLLSLTNQTLHGTSEMMKDIEPIKEAYREDTPYKAGFILSMLKKSRDVVNELFNVAIKHRDEWQALEQLKIFEIIVHTNIDTSHLLKQLLDLQKDLDAAPNKSPLSSSTDKIDPGESSSTDKIDPGESSSTDKIDPGEMETTASSTTKQEEESSTMNNTFMRLGFKALY